MSRARSACWSERATWVTGIRVPVQRGPGQRSTWGPTARGWSQTSQPSGQRAVRYSQRDRMPRSSRDLAVVVVVDLGGLEEVPDGGLRDADAAADLHTGQSESAS